MVHLIMLEECWHAWHCVEQGWVIEPPKRALPSHAPPGHTTKALPLYGQRVLSAICH